MKQWIISFLLFSVFISTAQANIIEGKIIERIDVKIHTDKKDNYSDNKIILSQMQSQKNTNFSQLIFDKDLKNLSENFDVIDPKTTLEDNKVIILINLWTKPIIRNISWEGNKHFSNSKLQGELNVTPNTIFNKQEFNIALNKVKDFYLTRGYFESEMTYKIVRENDEAFITINIVEGKAGKIGKIQFKGLTKEEEKEVKPLIHSKKYNLFISWLNGQGYFRNEILEQDQITILHFLQNKGYADAKLNVNILEGKSKDKIIIEMDLHRGPLYHFGKITFAGNNLITDEEIEKAFLIYPEGVFSPEKIQNTSEAIRHIYGQKGYVEANVYFDTVLMENEPIYNVNLHIEEGEQFKIGLIKVYGNMVTKTNVILRESLLVPGEIFDSRRLRATQMRLENMGYFKNVNVYAVHASEDEQLGPNYRDIHVEVEETTTGSINLFVGMSSLNDVYGGLELTEKNFNYKGLFSLFSKGPSSLRGGGEYAHAKVNIGAKQQSYLISWLNPYVNDSLWRLGFEASITSSELISSDYKTQTTGFSVYTAYPLSNYWTFGSRYRLRYTHTNVDEKAGEIARKEGENNGFISAVSSSIGYDSTDNAFKAHRGIRSSLDAEFVGAGGDFIFFKFGYNNSLYQHMWRNGTMKYRADFNFIEPIGHTNKNEIPMSERFFLGGETTVRGYKSYRIGPKFGRDRDPTGGISSALFSIEFCQELHKMLDLFLFADAGSVSLKHFNVPFRKLNASCGVGIRVDLMNRVPLMVGYAYPINSSHKDDEQRVFFSMGGQF
jgi:outer membrane protein insertion porin family